MNTTEMKYKIDQLGKLMKVKQKRQAEFDLMNQDLDENINGLKDELKRFFLERKESEKTDLLEVSYRKGAVRWDTKGLKEYAKAHSRNQSLSGGRRTNSRIHTGEGDSMKFFLEMVPPTVTAQMHKVTFQRGRVRFYDTKELKAARQLFVTSLLPHSPIQPMEGPVLLNVLWAFPTKTHKENEFRITRPDTDNLQKLLKDCMTAAGFWKDDAQVCMEVVTKRWTREKPGILIAIEALEEK